MWLPGDCPMHARGLIAGLSLLILATLPAAAETIQLEKSHSGLYVVPVRLNDAITVPFIIDSGASSVYISKDYFMRLRQTGTISQSDFIGTGTWVSADGSRHSDDRYLLHEVIVGNHIVRNVAATVGSGDESLLGQSFLDRLPAWTLDNARHTLFLNDPVNPVPTAPAITAPVITAFGNFGAFAYDDAAHRYGYNWNQSRMQSASAGAIKGIRAAP